MTTLRRFETRMTLIRVSTQKHKCCTCHTSTTFMLTRSRVLGRVLVSPLSCSAVKIFVYLSALGIQDSGLNIRPCKTLILPPEADFDPGERPESAYLNQDGINVTMLSCDATNQPVIYVRTRDQRLNSINIQMTSFYIRGEYISIF